MIGKPAKYQRTGIVFVALLVVLVIILGWRAASVIGPRGGDDGIDAVPSTTPSGKQFLVYRTHHVADRGEKEWPNDDVAVYEFLRFPLAGTAVPERLFRIEQGEEGAHAGSPWMRRVSSDTLLFARRDVGANPSEAVWVDVSGTSIAVPETDPDLLWNGIPSPDAMTIAYADPDKGAVSVLTITDGLTRSFATDRILDIGYLAPYAWDSDGTTVYLKPVFEGEAFVAGLWTLDVVTGELREVEIVRTLGISNYTIATGPHMLAGSTFICESLETCGTGPSALYLIDLRTEDVVELQSDDHLAFGRPVISPDARRIAYTLSAGSADIWMVDSNEPQSNRRLISGTALEWTADGRYLAVDRDNELQLLDVTTGEIMSVARRSGTYQDPDFRGVDFIGIVEKR